MPPRRCRAESAASSLSHLTDLDGKCDGGSETDLTDPDHLPGKELQARKKEKKNKSRKEVTCNMQWCHTTASCMTSISNGSCLKQKHANHKHNCNTETSGPCVSD
jgi:hypothetical protein